MKIAVRFSPFAISFFVFGQNVRDTLLLRANS